MNKFSRLITLLVVITMLAGCLAACVPEGPNDDNTPDHTHNYVNGVCDCGEQDPDFVEHTHSYVNGVCSCGKKDPNYVVVPEFVDYASQLKYNPNSGKKHVEVTVKSYIDGDTTHFYINDPDISEGYLKARYLGINTPESTGVIEPWGKKASNYTKTQLQKATSIIIESDTDSWNLDSTGERYLLWVWYRTSEDSEYRNLNIEILQQGLAYGSNAASNTYSVYTMGALNQAKALKLHVFSKTKDPDFYYGGAIPLTLKELKSNCEKYEGKLVQFEAVVTKQIGPTIFVEEYDAENDLYLGMQLYAGFNYPKMSEFAIGNRLSIVGTLSYYETGGTYQVSNLQYDVLDPNWEEGCRVIGQGGSPSFNELDVYTIVSGKVSFDVVTETEDENGDIVETTTKREFDYGELAHYSSVTVKNLTVKSVWTTNNGGDSDGALTITCTDQNGDTIQIHTDSKLIREDGSIVVASDFPKNTVISVKGIIDSYNGKYQVKVFSINDITFE